MYGNVMSMTIDSHLLTEEYKEKRDKLLQFTKKYEENKTSLESLKRNFADDQESSALLQTAIDSLTIYSSKQEEEYTKLAEDLSNVERKIKDYRTQLLSNLRQTLGAYESIAHLIDMEPSEQHEHGVLIAKCAKHLYPRTVDTHDLRATPPICGVVYKDDLRKPFDLDTKGRSNMDGEFHAYEGGEFHMCLNQNSNVPSAGHSNAII